MKTLFTTLVAAAMLAGLGAPANAATKHKKKYASYQANVPRSSANGNGSNLATQAQYDINKLPFGSQIWWEQYLRTSGGSGEGGGGNGGGGSQ